MKGAGTEKVSCNLGEILLWVPIRRVGASIAPIDQPPAGSPGRLQQQLLQRLEPAHGKHHDGNEDQVPVSCAKIGPSAIPVEEKGPDRYSTYREQQVIARGGERNLAFSIAFGTWSGNWEKASVSVKRHRGDWDSRNPGLNSVLFNQKHVYDLDVAAPPSGGDSYTWRVIRSGRTITVERSDDGVKFVTQAQNTYGPQIDGLIQYFRILGDSFGNADAYGDFDYVRLTRNP